MRPRFIGSEVYRGSSYGAAHPLRIPRVTTAMDLGRALGWLPREAYLTSPRAKPAALQAFHTARYVGALMDAERDQRVSDEVRARHDLGTASNPVYPEVFRRPATAAGGSIWAGQLLKDGGKVHNCGGGTHHGMPDRANGFCYLNDPVLGILSLRRSGIRRVAYVDIDAHHPDGVALAFSGDPEVMVISTHEAGRWPRTGAIDERGAGNLWNLPLPRGAHDDDMALAAECVIWPLVARHRPEAIVLQCGADAVEEDPLSGLALSNRAHMAVLRGLMGMAPRFLLLGGGGYNPWTVGRLWTAIWGVLSEREMPDRLPPAAEAVLRAIGFPGNRRGLNPPEYLFTTLVDAPRTGPVSDAARSGVATLTRRMRAEV